MKPVARTAAKLEMRTQGRRRACVAVSLLVILPLAVFAPISVAQILSIETCQTGQPVTSRGFPDGDGDGVADAVDNCLEIANPNQRDTDEDIFGNRCDPDLNNDGMVNTVDLGLLRPLMFTTDMNADFDGDGVVSVTDLGIMKSLFFEPPGPAGFCLRDTTNCSGPAYFEFADCGQPMPGSLFVFRSNDPSVIYHSRRLISGASQCNPHIMAETFYGMESYNPIWHFHIGGIIRFFGSSHGAPSYCDLLAVQIENNLSAWCPAGDGAPCQLWCPWFSILTRELTPPAGN